MSGKFETGDLAVIKNTFEVEKLRSYIVEVLDVSGDNIDVQVLGKASKNLFGKENFRFTVKETDLFTF